MSAHSPNMDIRRHVLDHLSIDLALFQKPFLRLDTDLSEDFFAQTVQTGNWTLVPLFKYELPEIENYYCLRIIPWEPIENWPLVIYQAKLNTRITVGKNAHNFLTSLLYFFIGIRISGDYQLELRKKHSELEQLFDTVPALLKDERMWRGLLNIIAGELSPNIFEPHPADDKFLLLSDNSPAHQTLRRELLKARTKNNDGTGSFHIPEFIDKDYGYLNSLMSNAVLICASATEAWCDDLDVSRRAIWRAMSEITFFDAVRLDVEDIPRIHQNCRDTIYGCAGVFFSDDSDGDEDDENPPIAEAYRAHPLFAVLEALARHGHNRPYDGSQHLTLAAHYAGPAHDPRKAWNAAVNAGYWAVAHGGPFGEATSGEALEVAIRLCAENGWTAAHAVLADYRALQRRPLAN